MKEHSAAIHVQVPVDVATFLLNEKRAEIHLIESRLKVSITLIPNLHLETPHYSVTRLRHDDMTAENLQASYKLVTMPEESQTATEAAQETKPQRPQAVVQGITPAQPAPTRAVEVSAEPSFFSKLFAWLKPSAKAQPASQANAPKPRHSNQPRRDREGNRPAGNRPEGNRPDANRSRNKPRRDKDEAAPRNEKPAPAAPKAQEPRAERPPRPPRVAAETPALESMPPAATTTESTEDSGNRSGRKRGRRGGQRERGRRDQPTAGQAEGSQPISEGAGNASAGNAETARHNETAEQASIPAMEQRQDFVAPIPVAHTAPPAPVHVTTTAGGSNLVQIETDSVKRAAAPTPQAEAPSADSRRRTRPREVYSMESGEPLVQIETQPPTN